MNNVVLEIDGVRHRLVKEPLKLNDDSIEVDSCKKCSLFGMCCNIICEEFDHSSESDFYFTKENEDNEKE